MIAMLLVIFCFPGLEVCARNDWQNQMYMYNIVMETKNTSFKNEWEFGK